MWKTVEDYARDVVAPALGHSVEEYDTIAVAQDMTEWADAPTDEKGWTREADTGLIERTDVDFWDVAARHTDATS